MLDTFRQTAFNRAFELAVLNLIREGKVKCPTYLSLGSEHVPPAVLQGLGEKWPIFIQHRGHSYCLTWGMKPHDVLRQLVGGGMGSASLGDPDAGVFGHDGLLGSQVPVAVGYAQGSGRKTVCVLGDAACEEDYVLGAIGYAATHEVPVLFAVEDNELSVATAKPQRRSWSMSKVVRAMGLFAVRCEGGPETIAATVKEYCQHLPALIEVPVIRGCAHNSLRDQSNETSFYHDRWLSSLGDEGKRIEAEAQAAVADLIATVARCGGRSGLTEEG